MKINIPGERFGKMVEQFLLTLPEKEAKVFEMKCMHNKNKKGLSYKRMAQVLGLTEGEVRRLEKKAQFKFLDIFVGGGHLKDKPILH